MLPSDRTKQLTGVPAATSKPGFASFSSGAPKSVAPSSTRPSSRFRARARPIVAEPAAHGLLPGVGRFAAEDDLALRLLVLPRRRGHLEGAADFLDLRFTRERRLQVLVRVRSQREIHLRQLHAR